MTKELRVVETYVSYQGEGPNTSKPTVFVRFAGCNFKCPGWPCDTQHAIQPKQFARLQKFYAPEELGEKVASLDVRNVCLTGGEVFLQDKDALSAFLKRLRQATRANVECFTNGALPWGQELTEQIDTFVVDWKLPGSGEEYPPTTTLATNFEVLSDGDAIKFTIRDHVDYVEAKRRYREVLVKHYPEVPVYAGVVWRSEVTTEALCQWMIEDKLPWNLNVQVHKFIWHPDKIGV